MVTQAYNPSIREIKAERFQIQGHLGIHSQTQSQKPGTVVHTYNPSTRELKAR